MILLFLFSCFLSCFLWSCFFSCFFWSCFFSCFLWSCFFSCFLCCCHVEFNLMVSKRKYIDSKNNKKFQLSKFLYNHYTIRRWLPHYLQIQKFCFVCLF